MKRLIIFAIFTFSMGLLSPAFAGQHAGEQGMLDVSIDFSGSFGNTVTDSSGVHYYYGGTLIGQEDKIYPSQYLGSYPMYFFGTQVGVTVKVTNKGPRNRDKVRIVTESHVLNTDGSNGVALLSPRSIDVDLANGETKTIDASFLVEYVPGADSGLDRFVVKVLHQNEGGGPGNAEPSLIMAKEGVFCPPKFRP